MAYTVISRVDPILRPLASLENLELSESGCHPFDPNALVQIRDFPFPYRSALAISNDCDGVNRASYCDWHGFVNGSEPTSYGDGLGLEVGDSFFAWSGHRNASLALYFHNPGPVDVDSEDAAFILELARLGWFDTLHSFGNFFRTRATATTPEGPVPGDRSDIARVLDRLAGEGVRIDTWVNHSGSPSNIGGPWGFYQTGDKPGEALYSLDLLTDYGFRFYWIDPCTNMTKFGDGLNFGSPTGLGFAMNAFHWHSSLRRRVGAGIEPLDLPQDASAVRSILVGLFNRTINPVIAQDGRRILSFKRYRSEEQPTSTTFSYQVTSDALDKLEEQRGSVIIYQHFGVASPRGRTKHVGRQFRRASKPPVLDADAVACWQDIAERKRQGRLFVATTSRLLTYLHMRDTIRLTLEAFDERWVITMEGIDCPVDGFRPI